MVQPKPAASHRPVMAANATTRVARRCAQMPPAARQSTSLHRMSTTLALLAAAAGVGFGQAILPDHWVPLAVVGRPVAIRWPRSCAYRG